MVDVRLKTMPNHIRPKVSKSGSVCVLISMIKRAMQIQKKIQSEAVLISR